MKKKDCTLFPNNMTTHCAQSMPPRPSLSFFVAISCYNNGHWQQGAAGRLQPYYQCKRAICNGNCPWNGGIKQPPPKGSMDGSSDEARRKNRTPKSVKLPWEPQKLFGCLNWWWLDYKSGQESDTTTTRGDAMVRRLVFSSHVIAT